MATVIKRGGKREKFSPSKIKKSIAGAARKAKVSAKTKKELEETAKEVVAKFKERKLIKSAEIRRAVLAKLGRKAKTVAAAWKVVERKKLKAMKKNKAGKF
ncbi:MAG: ATP cone domain-containing protein [Parcubacteria group bacterium]|jgi:transcriptional regulator NrdR family protein